MCRYFQFQHIEMNVVKGPSFGAGNHPSETSGCQRGSYCIRVEERLESSRLEGWYSRENALQTYLRARSGID